MAEAEPDVSLEFASPGPFYLHNFGGTACEIRINALTLPEMYEVTFPLVADLHDGRIETTPAVKSIGLWKVMDPKRDDSARTVMDFLHSVARGVAADIQHKESGGSRFNSAITDRLVAQMKPIRLPITVTYKDRHRRRAWIKEEELVYDPPAHTAHIEHGTRKEITS
jgi:hypothetical protein